MITDHAEGSSRDANQRVVLGDQASAGYARSAPAWPSTWRCCRPTRTAKPNPADKDPVPPPFDNTYNSPEHDAFVHEGQVPAQRRVLHRATSSTAPIARGSNQAWNDLFGSWPYHDAYLGMLAEHYKLTLQSRHIQDFTPAAIAALPAAVRPHVAALRTHYDAVMRAQALAQPGHVADAMAFASRAWRRPLTAAEKTNLRAFYQRRADGAAPRSRRRAARADRPHPGVPGVPVSRRGRRAAAREKAARTAGSWPAA